MSSNPKPDLKLLRAKLVLGCEDFCPPSIVAEVKREYPDATLQPWLFEAGKIAEAVTHSVAPTTASRPEKKQKVEHAFPAATRVAHTAVAITAPPKDAINYGLGRSTDTPTLRDGLALRRSECIGRAEPAIDNEAISSGRSKYSPPRHFTKHHEMMLHDPTLRTGIPQTSGRQSTSAQSCPVDLCFSSQMQNQSESASTGVAVSGMRIVSEIDANNRTMSELEGSFADGTITTRTERAVRDQENFATYKKTLPDQHKLQRPLLVELDFNYALRWLRERGSPKDSVQSSMASNMRFTTRYIVLNGKNWKFTQVGTAYEAEAMSNNPALDAGNGVLVYLNDTVHAAVMSMVNLAESRYFQTYEPQLGFRAGSRYDVGKKEGAQMKQLRRQMQIPKEIPEGTPMHVHLYQAVERMKAREMGETGNKRSGSLQSRVSL